MERRLLRINASYFLSLLLLTISIAVLRAVIEQQPQEEQPSAFDYTHLSTALLAHQQQTSSTVLVLQSKPDSSQTQDQSYKSQKNYYALNVQELTRIRRIESSSSPREQEEEDNILITADNNNPVPTLQIQARASYRDILEYCFRQHHLYTNDSFLFIPPVVPEFASITIGGAVVGGGLESTSHRYGQVSDANIQSVTLLLGNGTIISSTSATATDDYYATHDLFHALPGSHGTLGIVLDVTVKLIPAQPFVALTIQSFTELEEGVQKLQDMLLPNNQDDFVFLESLYFMDGRFAIVSGTWYSPSTLPVEDRVHKIIRPTTGRGLWFYEEIQQYLKDSINADNTATTCDHDGADHRPNYPPQQLLVPTYDYLFRYERGAFWMARPMQFQWKYCFQNPFTAGLFLASWKYTRFLFSSLFTATRLYKLLHLAHPMVVADRMIIVDIDVPIANATKLVNYVRQNIPLTTPLWLLPVRGPTVTQPLSNTGHGPNEMLINVGIYGRVPDDNGIEYSRKLTEYTWEIGGRHMLYSQVDMTEEEFYENRVDRAAYDRLRKKYAAEGVFPPLHEKVLRKLDKERKGLRYWLTKLLL